MASWMIHLRVAEKLIEKLNIENEREFIVGNIAPDSGEPNEDWSAFTPSTKVSHFREVGPDGVKNVNEHTYINKYFSKELQENYSDKKVEFYLGYLTHLLTDKLWVRDIVIPASEMYQESFAEDKKAFLARIKEDWYDMDALYLKEHPDFKAFQVYSSCEGFKNEYLDFFSEMAFDNRRKYIVNFYLENIQIVKDRKMYIAKSELDRFVETAADEIAKEVQIYLLKERM